MKNRVQLIGHVGQEPEIKNLESGKVANFTIATNENYTNAKGEKVEQTEWHRVSAWGKTARRKQAFYHGSDCKRIGIIKQIKNILHYLDFFNYSNFLNLRSKKIN